MLPEGWEHIRLREGVSKIGSGVTPRGGEESYKSTGYPLIRSQNVGWGCLLLDNVSYIDLDQHNAMSGTKLKSGDVLLNITGASIGRVATYYGEDLGANVNQHVCIIRTDGSLEPRFVEAFLLSEFGQKQVDQFQAGGNRQGLNFEQVGSFRLPRPPLPEQRKIVEILSTWDAAIGAQERLIANARRQKKALMQTLLPTNAHTPKQRLPGFSGEWQEIKLRELGRCYNGVTYAPTDVVEKGGLLILRSSNVQKGRLAFEDTVFVKPDVKTSCLTQEGDILICVRNGSRNLIGKTARITSDATGHAHGAFMSLFRSTEPDFAYHLFQCDAYDLQVKRNLGATINSINTSDLHKFRFFVPPKPERARIAQILTASDSEIEQHEKLLFGMRTQKLALMQQLLTGKRRVQLDESEVV